MKIGIFGGTFNPIHIGHIRGAISVFEIFGLDKVVFIPTGIPPHKKDAVIDAQDRYEMVRLALEGLNSFEVSSIEIDKHAVNYTVDTIEEIKSGLDSNDEIFFLVGTDAFYYLNSWKDYDRLANLVTFVLMKRPEYNLEPIVKKYKDMLEFLVVKDKGEYEAIGRQVFVYEPPAFDVSSSMIRQKIVNGDIIRYLVPESVEEFIKRKGLYRL